MFTFDIVIDDGLRTRAYGNGLIKILFPRILFYILVSEETKKMTIFTLTFIDN